MIFDSCMSFLYHYLEQNGCFWLICEMCLYISGRDTSQIYIYMSHMWDVRCVYIYLDETSHMRMCLVQIYIDTSHIWHLRYTYIWVICEMCLVQIYISAQGCTNRTLAVHERVDSRFLVLPGSESTITEITEYIYFSALKPIRAFEYKSE